MMTNRYCQALGFDDVYKRHVVASPVDRLLVGSLFENTSVMYGGSEDGIKDAMDWAGG
jgi:hypothetical protein